MNQQHPFKWRHFEASIIFLCVRWYLRYSLSYRDLEEMMQERGLDVDHPPSLVGYNAMHQNWSDVAAPISKPRPTPGASMRPMSK